LVYNNRQLTTTVRNYMSKKIRRSDIENFIVEQNPYALATINLNSNASQFGRSVQAEHSLDRVMKTLSLHLDQAFFGTRHVVDEVEAIDRFDALCFYEKLSGFPHAHCAFFLPRRDIRGGARFLEVNRRKSFLLRHLHSRGLPIASLADQSLADIDTCPVDPRRMPILHAIDRRLKCDVRSITNLSGVAHYVTKEIGSGQSCRLSNYRLLSEYHSHRQLRTTIGFRMP